MRVLILDDNKDAAEMLTLFMRHVGYETAKEYDGHGDAAGFDAHIVKPVSMAHLHQLMLELTGAQQR